MCRITFKLKIALTKSANACLDLLHNLAGIVAFRVLTVVHHADSNRPDESKLIKGGGDHRSKASEEAPCVQH